MSDRRGERLLKRAVDVAVSATALALLAPALAATGAVLGVTLGRPVLFRQRRPGLHGKPFELVKFRTMLPPKPGEGPESDRRRLTRVGRALRATSIDELPSLWNVLRGDMSLVGPRPLLMEYLPRYTARQARRHDVKPGITGWAQIHGRNRLSWEQKFDFDVWYVDNWSLALDARILLRTLERVLRRDGISALGHATMPVFEGPDVEPPPCPRRNS